MEVGAQQGVDVRRRRTRRRIRSKAGSKLSGAILQEALHLALKQIEFYFSDENLVQDLYLRSNMDASGYLPIAMVAAFPKVAVLGAPWEDLLEVLSSSHVLEVNLEHATLRARDRPLRWVFPQPQPPWQHQPPFPTPSQGTLHTPDISPEKGQVATAAAAAGVVAAAAAAVPSPKHASTTSAADVRPAVQNRRGGSGSRDIGKDRAAPSNYKAQIGHRSGGSSIYVEASTDAAVPVAAAAVTSAHGAPAGADGNEDDAATDVEGNGSNADSSDGAVSVITCAPAHEDLGDEPAASITRPEATTRTTVASPTAMNTEQRGSQRGVSVALSTCADADVRSLHAEYSAPEGGASVENGNRKWASVVASSKSSPSNSNSGAGSSLKSSSHVRSHSSTSGSGSFQSGSVDQCSNSSNDLGNEEKGSQSSGASSEGNTSGESSHPPSSLSSSSHGSPSTPPSSSSSTLQEPPKTKATAESGAKNNTAPTTEAAAASHVSSLRSTGRRGWEQPGLASSAAPAVATTSAQSAPEGKNTLLLPHSPPSVHAGAPAESHNSIAATAVEFQASKEPSAPAVVKKAANAFTWAAVVSNALPVT